MILLTSKGTWESKEKNKSINRLATCAVQIINICLFSEGVLTTYSYLDISLKEFAFLLNRVT